MIYKIGQKYNKGNFIPKYECDDTSVPGGTAAALELACVINKCNTVGVIGHADSKVIFLKLFNTNFNNLKQNLLKTLNLLYERRNNLEDAANDKSQLMKWLLLNGKDSVEKFKDFEKSGYKKMLTFSSWF